MKKYYKLTVLALTATLFMACSDEPGKGSGEETGEKDKQFQAIAEQYLNGTVNVTYKNLADASANLVEKLKTVKTEQTENSVADACKVFLEARAWWEKSEAFLFGAASDFGIDPHIDSWPLDQDGLIDELKNASHIAAMEAEDADVWAGAKLGPELLGFHGIEYIIFKDGAPKPVAEITADQLTYAIAVAGDLRNKCFQLEMSWAGEDAVAPERAAKIADLEWNTTTTGGLSYSENMLMAGQPGSTYVTWTAAMQAIVDGCKTIADEVGTSKIGKPHTGEDPNYIESPYSHMSIIDFYDNIVSIENSYMGGLEDIRDESKSLHAYIKTVNPELDKKVTDAIDNAAAKIKAMKAPFVENYRDPSAQEAIKACTALDDILSEVQKQLAK